MERTGVFVLSERRRGDDARCDAGRRVAQRLPRGRGGSAFR